MNESPRGDAFVKVDGVRPGNHQVVARAAVGDTDPVCRRRGAGERILPRLDARDYGWRSDAGMWMVVRAQQSQALPPRLTFQVTYSLSPFSLTAVLYVPTGVHPYFCW